MTLTNGMYFSLLVVFWMCMLCLVKWDYPLHLYSTLEKRWIEELSYILNVEFIFIEKKYLRNFFKSYVLLMLVLLCFQKFILVMILLSLTYGIFKMGYPGYRRYRNNKMETQLTSFLQNFSSSIFSGQSIEASLEHATQASPKPIADEFELVLKESKIGGNLHQALQRLQARMDSNELRLFIQALILSLKIGSSLTHTVTMILEILENRRDVKNKLTLITAQSRMQAWAISILPFAFFFITHLLIPDHFSALLDHPLGKTIIFASLISLSIGIVWVHRICNRNLYEL